MVRGSIAAGSTEDAARVVEATAWLRDESDRIHVDHKVTHVYNPLRYAWEPHQAYLQRYARGTRKAVLVGMNPGPWGMGQTGIPFGTVEIVRGWLDLDGLPIGRPARMHEKRPVEGWDCTRQEISGQRVWGLLETLFGTPDRALTDLFIANHCPLLLYDDNGTNITPDKLRKADRERVYDVCDEGLRRVTAALEAETLIGVGAYAESRCAIVAEGTDIQVARIPHPSPASPLANKDGGIHWRRETARVLEEVGVLEAGAAANVD